MSSQPPSPRKRNTALAYQAAMAMELPFIIVGGALAGGFIGYLLDRWLHTTPFLMLVVGALGFGAGMWDILKRLSRADKNQGKGDAGG